VHPDIGDQPTPALFKCFAAITIYSRLSMRATEMS
jgi:hypothetical protein